VVPLAVAMMMTGWVEWIAERARLRTQCRTTGAASPAVDRGIRVRLKVVTAVRQGHAPQAPRAGCARLALHRHRTNLQNTTGAQMYKQR
jgi:hypothetical protein